MRTLSIRQPWAWLIVRGFKPIENRLRASHFRGPLLIHASLKMTQDDYEACRIFVDGFATIELPKLVDLPRGGIIGQVTMTDCVTASTSPWFCGGFGYVFTDARPLPFRPSRASSTSLNREQQNMTRTQKIQKLANAVKEYRGSYNQTTRKWLRPPNPEAAHRAAAWLQRLNLPVGPTMERINDFTHVTQFHAWIQSL